MTDAAPPPDDSEDEAAGRRIDDLCDRFEAAWRAGACPRIEAILDAAPAPDRRPLLRELVALEAELRRARGEHPRAEEYRGRFPEAGELIAPVFAGAAASLDPSPPLPPDVEVAGPARSRFRILRLWARGGLGDVYVARDDQLDRDVALKQVRPDLADDPECRRRLEDEARITGALEHPGIVPVYAAARRSDGEPYYVMRLIRGRSLAEAIAEFHASRPWRRPTGEQKLALRRLLEHLVAAGRAVAFAHSRGVLHRDLKPANVLLGDYGETWVVDWGLAKPTGTAGDPDAAGGVQVGARRPEDTVGTREGELRGTPGYASPEQVGGRIDEVGPTSDVYGLGSTLYHLLAGRPPFDPLAPLEALRDAASRDAFPRPRDVHPAIPRGLEAICLKAMAREPAARYGSVAALVEDLERWLADEPVTARREPSAARAGRWARRHRTGVVAAAIAATMAAAIGAREWQRGAADAARLEGLIQALPGAAIADVPRFRALLEPHGRRADPRLARLADEGPDAGTRVLAALMLPPDPARAGLLFEPLLEADFASFAVLLDHLRAAPGDAVPRLWAVLDDLRADPGRRFRAACALATLDPGDAARATSRWPGHARFVVARLAAEVRREPSARPAVVERLRPVRDALSGPLVEMLRGLNDPPSEGAADLAAELLPDYAADRPEILADAIPDVDDRHYGRFLDRLRVHPERAAAALDALLARPADAWPEAPPDPSWAAPRPDLVAQIERADGLFGADFALCQTMPLDQFVAAAEGLRSAGYRPIRVRPFAAGGSVLVAAAWTRDPLDWRLALGATAREVTTRDEESRAEGFVAVDVAGYVSPDPAGRRPVRHAALWAEATDPFREARVRAGRTGVERSWIAWPVPRYPPGSVRIEVGRERPLGEADGVALAQHAVVGVGGRTEWSVVHCGPRDPVHDPPYPFVGAEGAYRDRVSRGGPQWDVCVVPTADGPRYAALFLNRHWVESAELHGLGPEEHRERGRELARRGYRPAAIAVVADGDARPPIAASVWHRPWLPPGERGLPVRRHAQAAITLIHLGRDGPAWGLLRHSPDPSVRSLLIHRFRPLGVDVRRLVRRLAVEPDTSARRALVLALGEYPAEALPGGERDALVASLTRAYRDDPDPGLHAACAWLLRRWDRGEDLARIDREARSAGPADGRRWYVDRQGQTLTVVPGPEVEFAMGRRAWDRETEEREPRHRARIRRSFAIGAVEVTRAQYEEFLREHPECGPPSPRRHRLFSPEPDCPVTAVTWYDAARYCRWLSERDGVPEGQMCYPPLDRIRDDRPLELPADHLRRTGYRLPTEAEWEYACRAGAVTYRFYGSDEPDGPFNLLANYAWYYDERNRSRPVGSLKPNDLGLFDVLGNAHEWCQDPFSREDAGAVGPLVEDREHAGAVHPQANRVRRGGWFHYPATGIYSDLRSWDWASYPNAESGFRLARTLP